MLSFAAGIILSTILFNGDLRRDEWVDGHSNMFVLLSAVSFFMGAIIGAIVASFMVQKWPKKQIKHVSIVLFYIAGILLTALPSNAAAILVARVFSGMGFGYIQVVFIVHGSEVSVSKLRGMFLNTFNFCLGTGLVVGTAFMMTNQVNTGLPHYRAFGIFIIFYTALAHLFLYIFCVESPIFLLQQGDVIGATQAMMKLRNESVESWDIRNDVSEFKAMLVEDSQCDKSLWSEGNSRPLLILICAKLLLVLSFNYPLNVIRINTVDATLYKDDLQVAGVMLSTTRLLVSLLTLFAVDFFGRRFHLLYGSVSAGALAILLSIFLFLNTVSAGGLEAPTVFAFLFETLPVFAYGISDILCGEAFPIVKKPQSIALIIIIENIIQATLLISTFTYLNVTNIYNVGEFYIIPLVMGLIILILTYICFKFVPETTRLSIRETKNLFRGSPQNTVAGVWYSV